MSAHFEELNTASLKIVPFGERHLTPAYVGWLNDPDVVRFSEQRHKKHTAESCDAYYRSLVDTPHLYLAIESIKPPLGHIGNMTVAIDPVNGLADIAIMIGEKKAWGKGLGLEAWSAVLECLLAEDSIRKVTAGTVAPNLAMVSIMRRSGMIEDGRRAYHLLVDDAPEDVVHFAAFA